MDIKEIAVENIKAYAKNAKKHDEKQIKQIANSIKKFGFKQPVVIDSNNEIIIGHGRVEAARTLGMKTVPCVIASDLSEEEVKALRVADNKLNESPWDFNLLDEELDTISSIDMKEFGFEDKVDIEWDDVPDLSPELYEAPEHRMLECPSCHHVDRDIHFKKVEN